VGTRIGVSGRDSGRLGGIVTSGRDSGGLGGIVGGLGGGIVAPGRDSNGAGGGIEGFGRVGASVGCGTRLLACILGSNGCKAFLFFIDFAVLARQEAHVARTLLAGLEGSKRKQESIIRAPIHMYILFGWLLASSSVAFSASRP
jgi:hypothetical protein